jgi:hypothetical protein
VLSFDGERPAVVAAVASLPLMHAGLIEADLIELSTHSPGSDPQRLERSGVVWAPGEYWAGCAG